MRATMMVDIPEHARTFIEDIASITPKPVEVWLIGSRANERSHLHSDTDFLIFGPEELFELVRSQLQRPSGIDCLVVRDGEYYQDPWQEKSGSLSDLHWTRLDNWTATYVGKRWVPDEDSTEEYGADMGGLIKIDERAVRLYP